jgi:hypothetical protein
MEKTKREEMNQSVEIYIYLIWWLQSLILFVDS